MLAQTFALVLFPSAMICAGIMDVVTMTIRNWLTLALALSFFVLAPFAGFSASAMALSLGVAALVFLVAFGLFAAGWIGGGDAKLASAAALWFGWEAALPYFAVAGIAGGVLTLALLGFRALPLPASLRRHSWIARLHAKGEGVPYGAAFAAAALIVFPQTAWFAPLA